MFEKSFKGVLNCRSVVAALQLLKVSSAPDIIAAEAAQWLKVPAVGEVVLAKFLSLLRRGRHQKAVLEVEIAMDSKITNMALNLINPTMVQWASFFGLRSYESALCGLPAVVKADAKLCRMHKTKVEYAVKQLRGKAACLLQETLGLTQRLCGALHLNPHDNIQVHQTSLFVAGAPHPNWCSAADALHSTNWRVGAGLCRKGVCAVALRPARP